MIKYLSIADAEQWKDITISINKCNYETNDRVFHVIQHLKP